MEGETDGWRREKVVVVAVLVEEFVRWCWNIHLNPYLTRSLHSKGAAFNSLHCICLIWIGKIPALLLFNFL